MVPPTDPQTKRIRNQIAQAGGLVNAGELARHWGISRERVSQLVARTDFPEPVGEVAGRPVWLRDPLDTWRARPRYITATLLEVKPPKEGEAWAARARLAYGDATRDVDVVLPAASLMRDNPRGPDEVPLERWERAVEGWVTTKFGVDGTVEERAAERWRRLASVREIRLLNLP